MRTFKRPLALLVVFTVALAVFLGYSYAKKSVETVLSRFSEKNFDSRLTIGSLGFGFPLCLDIKNLGVNDTVSIPMIRIYPNPSSFFLRKSIIISRINIVEPVLKLKSKKDAKSSIVNFLKDRDRDMLDKITLQGVLLSKIRIKNGTFIYEDSKGKGMEFVKIRGDIDSSGFYFSKASPFHFEVAGFFKGKNFLMPLKLNGYLGADDIIKARLSADNIDADKLNLAFGRLLKKLFKDKMVRLESDMRISDKNLVARCYLEEEGFFVDDAAGEGSDAPLAASFILLINFNTKVVKIKKLQGNFLDLDI